MTHYNKDEAFAAHCYDRQLAPYSMFTAHVYAFWNAPLHQRPLWTRIQIAKIDAIENHGSPHAYDDNMQYRRKLVAGLVGKKAWEHDPAGYHYGMRSN